MDKKNSKLYNFIINTWEKTIRTNYEDNDTLIGLPKPYTVPCVEDRFQEMYYWDTYFANLGLLRSDMTEQAKNNAENMAFLINKYGFVPNGSRTWYLSRSQPPFFSKTVKDVFEVTGDKEWLSQMYAALKKEYDFFRKERMLPCGLFRYHGKPIDKQEIETVARDVARRINLEYDDIKHEPEKYIYIGYAFYESGWDCTSRFDIVKNTEFSWIDLDSLIYGMLADLAYFASVLQNGEEKRWQEEADALKKLICEKCYDKDKGMFCDYDFVNDKKSDFLSVACFYPLYVGLASKEQAEETIKKLPLLEQEYGVACCEPREDLHYLQWDYPNGWACLHHIIVKALLNYGYKADALRIAEKYCRLIEKNYEETENLWEKYNVVTGGLAKVKESRNSHMMGWSAGCYMYCLDICQKLENQ